LRAPTSTIAAPLFPRSLPWVNVEGTQASTLQRGRPMLVEFWDFCRPNSIRTLPYTMAWHGRYAGAGLRVIGVHCPGFAPARDERAVRDAVARLGVGYPVLIDSDFQLWREYENRGWPARYLFDGGARLFDYHFGEGAYEETELAIQELLGVERPPLGPLRPEDAPGARLHQQTADRPGAWCGPYEAGGVWGVFDGGGTVIVHHREGNGDGDGDGAPAGGGGDAAGGPRARARGGCGESRTLTVGHPGAYPLIEHERHTAGVLELEVGAGVECLATCFTPGVA
jgi:thiol-disulfide isomerase/thioredoxin